MLTVPWFSGLVHGWTSCFSLPSAPCFLSTLYLTFWCAHLFYHLSTLPSSQLQPPPCPQQPGHSPQMPAVHCGSVIPAHSILLPAAQQVAFSKSSCWPEASSCLCSLWWRHLLTLKPQPHCALLCSVMIYLTVSSPGRSFLSLHSWQCLSAATPLKPHSVSRTLASNCSPDADLTPFSGFHSKD